MVTTVIVVVLFGCIILAFALFYLDLVDCDATTFSFLKDLLF